jgi:hypothetical protein
MRERSAYRLAFATFRMPDRKPGVDTRIAPAGGDVPDSPPGHATDRADLCLPALSVTG